MCSRSCTLTVETTVLCPARRGLNRSHAFACLMQMRLDGMGMLDVKGIVHRQSNLSGNLLQPLTVRVSIGLLLEAPDGERFSGREALPSPPFSLLVSYRGDGPLTRVHHVDPSW
jgi:hypothetical protein